MHFLNRKKYDIIVIFHQFCKKHKWSKNEFENLLVIERQIDKCRPPVSIINNNYHIDW